MALQRKWEIKELFFDFSEVLEIAALNLVDCDIVRKSVTC